MVTKQQELTSSNHSPVVVTANNFRLPLTHIDNTMILFRYKSQQMELQHIYHILETMKILLLVFQLTTFGNYVLFKLDDVKIYRYLKVICTPTKQGRRQESVYVMSIQGTYVDKERKNKTADLWHARLGHVSYHELKIMMMKSILRGLPQLDVREDIVCTGCQYEKAHPLPYEESKFRVKVFLELIYSDVF